MPKVPISTRQVSAQTFKAPQVRAQLPGNLGGGGVAQGLNELAKKAEDIYKKEKNKAADSERKEFENDLREYSNTKLYDPEQGFKNVKGKGAASTYKDYQDDYASFVEERLKSVGSEDLRNKFKEIGESYRINHDKALNVHTSREMESHYNQVNKDTINSLQRTAVQNYESSITTAKPNAVMAEINANIEEYGKNVGMSQKSIDEMKLKSSNNLHKQLILTAVDKEQTQAAKEYLAKNKKFMEPETVRSINNVLKSSSILGESQKLVSDTLDKGLEGSEALKYIREKTAAKPELQQRAVQEYKMRHGEDKAFKQEKRIAYYENRGDDLYNDPKNFKLSANDLSTLTLAEQDNLNRIKANRLKELQGQPVSTNWAKYSELANMSHNDLQQTNLVKDYGSYLAPTHLKQFIDARAKGAKDYTSFRTKNQTIQALVNRTLDKGWIIDSDPTNEDIDYITGLYEAEMNKLSPEQKNSVVEQNKVIDRLTLEMEAPGFKNQRWKAEQKGIKLTKPSGKMPKGVPRNASWKEVRQNGVLYQGWEGLPDPDTGIKIFYGMDGNPLLRMKVK